MSTTLLELCGRPSITHRNSWEVPRAPDQAALFARYESRGEMHRIRVRTDALDEYARQGQPAVISGPLVEVSGLLVSAAEDGLVRLVTNAIRERVVETYRGAPTGFVHDECVNQGIELRVGDVYETGSLRTAVSLLNRYGLVLEAVTDDEPADQADTDAPKSRVKKR